MLNVFHTNIIAYCQQNWYVWFAVVLYNTDLFTLKETFLDAQNTNEQHA